VLALVVSLVLAVYILGPDVFSRLIVSLFAPARARSQNRTEEIARAFIISAVPTAIIYCIAHFVLHRFSNTSVLKDFLLGLYGDKSLEEHSDAFFDAAATVIRLNVLFLVIPVYTFALGWSISLGLLIRNYGKLLRRWKNYPKLSAILTWLVRPWAAEWHLKLSGVLLPHKTDLIRVDVLTKLDVLFRGTLIEHHLASDGALVSITLAEPQKFKRKELLEARVARPAKHLDTAEYWSPIEAHSFVIMAAEIVTLNLNYVDSASLKKKPSRVSPNGAKAALAAAKRKPKNAARQTDDSGK
jgi:hypothetical protein